MGFVKDTSLKASGGPHSPASLRPGKNPDTQCIVGWVSHRAGLKVFYEGEDIFPGTGCEPLISHHVA